MTSEKKEKVWANYEKRRHRGDGVLPSRRALEWLGHTIAERVGETTKPYLLEGETVDRAISTLMHSADALAPRWGRWLRLRWRLERVLVFDMVRVLHAKGVPRCVLEICMPVKGEFLSGLLTHGDPQHYRKNKDKTAERIEREIIKTLQMCPESKLYKGIKPLPPTDRELEKALRAFRVALNDFPELIPELKSFLSHSCKGNMLY